MFNPKRDEYLNSPLVNILTNVLNRCWTKPHCLVNEEETLVNKQETLVNEQETLVNEQEIHLRR